MSKTKLTLAEEFREIRRAATPWVCIATSDYRVTVRELLAIANDESDPPPVAIWDCVNGPRTLQGDGIDIGTSDVPPSTILTTSIKGLPAGGILFWVVPDTFAQSNHLWDGMFMARNVRQSARRVARPWSQLHALVIPVDRLTAQLPPLIADDVRCCRDPLPEEETLTAQRGLVDGLNKRSATRGRRRSRSAMTRSSAPGSCAAV